MYSILLRFAFAIEGVVYKKFFFADSVVCLSASLKSLDVMGGPRDSKVGFPIAKAGFKSSIVRGLIATILAPIGPKL